ncbi:restriction endonuclease subunit S [Aeromonas sp. QDB17]|uniref:restriction endonuclease subunit S n=1 Tax=Aeromonas sp. QDB17 TaxID=2990485 RepID=UPI0022E5488B|nr:restriction endonuclease subunit S [Aeromonas sp. QDB17]
MSEVVATAQQGLTGKYHPYPEYKDSGVEWLGEVPSHWGVLPCRAGVTHLVAKNTDGKEDNYLSLMANIGIVLYEDKGDVGNKKPDDLTKCKIVRKGNLVINSMNYAIGSYGMSPYDGICSPVYIILDANTDVVEQRYALRLFENKPFQKHLAILGNGILEHRAAIGWDDIKGQYIPFPSLPEQHTIAAFLDYETARIDRLIAQQQRLIELLKEKRQAVISHAVTKGLYPNAPMKDAGIEWLGQVPEHWAVVKLSYVLSLKSGDGITSNEIEPEGTYPVYGGNGLRGYCEQFNCNGTYALIGRQGALCGNVNVADGKFFASEHAVVVYPRIQFDVRFLSEFLRFMDLGQYSVSAAQPGISVERISMLSIAVPPIEEQSLIGQRISQVDLQIERLVVKAEAGVLLLKERRTALISAAVTGKIDLRGWTPPADEVAA